MSGILSPARSRRLAQGETSGQIGRETIERFKPLIQCADTRFAELPFLADYRSFKLRESRNRLMLHNADPRVATVKQLGYQAAC